MAMILPKVPKVEIPVAVSKADLAELGTNAMATRNHLKAAIDQMTELMAPNARNYPSAGRLQVAQKEHFTRIAQVRDVMAQIEAIIVGIKSQAQREG